ncbi:MAG TPA: bacterial transcriptional activator domain-containing protein, partial [Blastocatellia bacterium]|nr:bacterial transcriptional activator domain-containing protein [Blastocatellia bacterium]
QLLRCHPASERAFQQIMQMQYWSGNRSEALYQYERCVCALREDLGVAPGHKTQGLYEQIREDKLHASVISQAIIIPSCATTTSLSDVLSQLKQFQITLANMQQQLQLNIHLVEGCLSEPDRIQPR